MEWEEITLKEFCNGSESAFTTIYNKYVDILLSYGIGMGFEREVLKDAIQDVFFKLYFHREQLKEVKNLKFYLFRSLKNRLLDMVKTRVATHKIENHETKFSIKTTILDEIIQEEDKTAVLNKIDQLLSCLTNRQREAIYLRFIHEMDYEEIAELLEMTSQATRKLVSQGIQGIREKNLMLFFLIFILITT